LARAARQAILYVGGTVATAAGAHTMLAGGGSVPGQGPSGPAVESELRFYGAFYAAFGVAVLRTAPRADRERSAVRAIAGTLLLAGLARAGGWISAGRPHRVQVGLLAAELSLPPAILALDAMVSERPTG
jgi:hypothetical protein